MKDYEWSWRPGVTNDLTWSDRMLTDTCIAAAPVAVTVSHLFDCLLRLNNPETGWIFVTSFTWARILVGHVQAVVVTHAFRAETALMHCVSLLESYARTHGLRTNLVIHGKGIHIFYHSDTSSHWNYSCRFSWYKIVLCQRTNVPGLVYIDVYLTIFTNRK